MFETPFRCGHGRRQCHRAQYRERPLRTRCVLWDSQDYGKLSSPFCLCAEAHTVSPHGTDTLCIWKSFWELWLSDECAWVVWNKLTAFSEGTKVSLKFLGVLCNANCWQIWKISLKFSSGKKAFFQEKDLDAEWEEEYLLVMSEMCLFWKPPLD